MRRSDSVEVAARGAIIFFSFVSFRLRNAFGFLFIARSKTIEDQHQLLQNATTAMHIPSDVGFGAANLRLPQSDEGLLRGSEAAPAFCCHCVRTTYGWLSVLAVALQRGRETEFESFTVKRLGQNADSAPQ